MATEKTYNGDGSDTTFDITFPYLTHADIGVSVGGVIKTVGTDYSITGDTVTFTTAPASGTANVKLYRNTNIDTPEHEYSAGSSITAARLNENQKQALYAIEEAKLVTTTSGGITTGNKNDITVNSDTDWVIRTDAVEKSMMADNSVGTDQIETNAVTAGELADNAVDTESIVNDAVTADKLANSINTDIAANTAKVTNATHTGEVTGATALTIVDNIVDEANLKVDNTPTDGYVLTSKTSAAGGLTWAPAPTIGGSILEIVSYVCDGDEFTQRGVTYNKDDYKVDDYQAISSQAIVAGSTVEYTPPTGTKTVVYEFVFTDAYHNNDPSIIWHAALYLDGNLVDHSGYTKYAKGGGRNIMKWAFHIGGTANTNIGRVASWTSSKTIIMKARSYYPSNNDVKFHQTKLWNGSVSSQLSVPTLTLTAIS
tara:strand:- start:2417 stop:3697 length:1281 start_codon:yes stop_codon:yes gene_type:complete